MFFSNFLNTNLFKSGFQTFAVWFVLSIFAFSCGWLIDRTLDWVHGGKVLFSAIVATTAISVIFTTFFDNYFGMSDLMYEDIILYTLRNVTLGAIGFFGMAVSQVMILQQEKVEFSDKVKYYEKQTELVKKEADLLLREAKNKSESLLMETKIRNEELKRTQENLEEKLKELIKTEIELLKKYENNDV